MGGIMKVLKFFVVVLSIFGMLVFSYGYLNDNEVLDTLINYYNRTPSTLENNAYEKEVDISFVKITDDFEPNNKQDLMNIYYTILSSGMNEFTFYCNKTYTNCISDVLAMNYDSLLLSQFNNFVNVYNTFKSIKTTYTNSGKVSLSIEKVYSSTDIENINSKINTLYSKIVDPSKDNEYNIKSIHDYIINNTKYDVESEDSKEFSNASSAIGVLFDKLATCNGYTDTMSIFLDKLGVTNLRVSNTKHIWNLVYINNQWLHLDLTWDDPVNNLNKDILTYDYYLQTTDKLKQIDRKKDKNDHAFDEKIYNFAL